MGVAGLHEAVGAMAEADLGLIDDTSLHDDVVGIGRELARLSLVFAQHVREWEQRGIFERDGSKSSAHRLAREMKSSLGDRRIDVRRARRIDDLPLTVQAVLDGRLSLDHFDLLASVNTDERRDLFARDEATLVEQCLTIPYFDAYKLIRYWAERADQQLAAERAASAPPPPTDDVATDDDTTDDRASDTDEQPEPETAYTDPDDEFTPTDPASRLYANRTIDDVVDLRGMLGPIDGTIVLDELDRLAELIRQDDQAKGITRTASERRAAALVEMARRSATAPENGRRPRPLFSVLVGDESVRHLCELGNGIVVSPRQLLPYLSTSMLETILFDGPSTVISVSSQRTFRGALRRAIQVRDRRCRHPSQCDVPADRCQIDHIVPASRGGPTSQFNGRAECDPHNMHPHLHDHDAQPYPERPVTREHQVWVRVAWGVRQPPDPGLEHAWRVWRLPWIPPEGTAADLN